MSIAPTGALPAALARTLPATPIPAATTPAAGASAAATSSAGAAGAGVSTPAQAAATKAASQFERVLLEQLTKELASTAAPEGDDASAATSAYRDMLPATMADALSQAGGIGIAAQLARATAVPATATPTATVS